MFKLIPERKEFLDYAARIAARPAAQRAETKDKEMARRRDGVTELSPQFFVARQGACQPSRRRP